MNEGPAKASDINPDGSTVIVMDLSFKYWQDFPVYYLNVQSVSSWC
jgi:hypothetical protein